MRFAIAFLFVVTWTAGQCAGFDYASACARPNRASRGRALPDAPCDLSKHTYCTTPGKGYPWHAIRRFVRENQGLMRRMYGEERQISIIKAELENFIEDGDDEDFDAKTSDFAEDIIKTKMMYTKMSAGRAMRDKPHFRPINSEKNKKLDNDTLKVKPLDTNQTKVNNPDNSNKTEMSNETVNEKETTTDGYDSTTEAGKDAWRPMNADTSTLPPTLLFSEHEKVKIDRIDTKVTDKKEEFHPRPVQHQESVRPSVIKLRGANACESKEQIAAPFWANSTRGEQLALLNMYPYEQYIHLETCVHERKQMYCREGCRCEQQFRLHRLLAYDPRNECRGIFAEWFKFPSCCVCKCYDVPLEFRARSPRILHPQYDEEVKRVIYEDVARDWYSMSAYGDDEDLF
ncbi:protein spaetzle 4 isoform X2 [Trichoplusia ni]|uniref:Protein spaetzle 4 isoform X2 n=1 Tax=Trichoplusia ni TaxID=7111 RepID=A0A7E5VY29_TRINI|nr:protein spaetzle 4 isoform X2 [Trichoplusia ni]